MLLNGLIVVILPFRRVNVLVVVGVLGEGAGDFEEVLLGGTVDLFDLNFLITT